MRIWTITIFTLIINSTFGQCFKNDSIIKEFTNILTSKGIDTILIYEELCHGCPPITIKEKDSCYNPIGTPQTYFIFWRNMGQDYATKLSNYSCYYETINYDIDTIWTLFFTNESTIKNELNHIEKDTSQNFNSYLSFQIRLLYHADCIDIEITKDLMYLKSINCDSNSIRNDLLSLIEKEINNIEKNKLIKNI